MDPDNRRDLHTRRTGGRSASEWWRRARSASDHGRWSTGLRLSQQALRRWQAEADVPPTEAQHRLHARILISLAYNHSELGHPERARRCLDQAAALPVSLPAVRVARAMILVRTGQPDAALADFDLAVAELRSASSARSPASLESADPNAPTDELEDLAGALINRGLMHIGAGRLEEAAADTEAAGVLARRLDRGDIVFMADHNLGYVRYLAGDLPGALAAMEAAVTTWPDSADGISQLDRAQVLAAAGLVEEAREYVDLALESFHANRATADLVDAYALQSELDLLAENAPAAAVAARRAEQIARRRGNESAALAARILRFQAARIQRRDAMAGGAAAPPPPAGAIARGKARRDAVDAGEVAARMDEIGLVEEARIALLLQADALLDAADVPAAVEVMAAIHRRPGQARLASRLHTRLVDGRLELAVGRRAAGLAHIRLGLDELAHFQASFGSQDMQAAASVHGRELARLGLRTAVETKSPAAIFQWLERARGVSTRLPTVRPPADPEFARDLGEFRAGFVRARQAVLAGQRDLALEVRVREQRRRVQARAWSAAGTGHVSSPLALAAVQRRLAADPEHPTVVAYIRGDGVVHALTITASRATFRQLGSFGALQAQVRRVVADLDLLAAQRVPQPVRQVAQQSLDAGLDRLAELLLRPLVELPGSGPLLITGLGTLAMVPWGLLPELRGRPVSVSSSVTSALAAAATRPAQCSGVLTVAGPGLANGTAEAEQVAALHPGAQVLVEEAATAGSVLRQIPDGGLLHIAAHGHHEAESPLFSSVLLADGPLYGYDIAPNPELPAQVVLSSCEVGRSDAPVGEPLGLATALLRSGVATVIAGVSRVSDDLAVEVMTGYHRRLAAGDRPARALAHAVGQAPERAAFSCFGSGS